MELRKSIPGLPLGVTPEGDKLYGPAPACANCLAPRTDPGALVCCTRCAREFHRGCLDAPPPLGNGSANLRGWVCELCARCDACGADSPTELAGH